MPYQPLQSAAVNSTNDDQIKRLIKAMGEPH